jgi:hypothetical protein
MIDAMVGEQKIYPSRSELVRLAVRDFLIKELTDAKTLVPAPPFQARVFGGVTPKNTIKS